MAIEEEAGGGEARRGDSGASRKEGGSDTRERERERERKKVKERVGRKSKIGRAHV